LVAMLRQQTSNYFKIIFMPRDTIIVTTTTGDTITKGGSK